MSKQIQTIFLTFTVKQIEKILKMLYIACDNVGVNWTKDKDLNLIIKKLQAELESKTGKWWIS